MPKTKKEVEKTKNKKVESTKSSEFSFGQISKKEDDKKKKEEQDNRRALIDELIGASKNENIEQLKYTVEETDYVPSKFVVVITTNGLIYQEPVPRYFDYKNFVGLLASAPDRMIIAQTMIDFDANLSHTAFEVKGVDCEIVTADFNGYRSENAYSKFFSIKNGTSKIGGNLIFAGPEKPFTKKQAKDVVSQIIKILNNSEEIVEWK